MDEARTVCQQRLSPEHIQGLTMSPQYGVIHLMELDSRGAYPDASDAPSETKAKIRGLLATERQDKGKINRRADSRS